MRYSWHATVLAAAILAGATSLEVAAHTVPAGSASLRYQVTILPGSKAVFVEGLLTAPRERVTGWIAGAAGLGETSRLPAPADQFRFGYSILIPQRERSNSTDSELDGARLRSWGSGLFLVPSLSGEAPGLIEVCFTTPSDWTLVTPAGGASCVTVAGVDELLSLPVLAGDFQAHVFRTEGAEVTLALREGHLVPPERFTRSLTRLIKGASDYLRTPPPRRIFFGIDRLREGGTTYAPANNVSGPGRSATLLIDSDAAVEGRKYWGTYAHEYVHSWIPRGFGNSAATREQLGSVFIEGFTDYLAYRIAFAAGLLDRPAFGAALSEFYLEYREAVAQQPSGNPEFLRYRQGMMAAWMLDLELLKATGGRAGFRELMRLLMERHLGTDGISREEMKDALRSLGGPRLAALHDQLTDTTKPIDFAAHLSGTGISLQEVEDFTAAIESEQTPVRLVPRDSRQRRFLERWLRG